PRKKRPKNNRLAILKQKTPRARGFRCCKSSARSQFIRRSGHSEARSFLHQFHGLYFVVGGLNAGGIRISRILLLHEFRAAVAIADEINAGSKRGDIERSALHNERIAPPQWIENSYRAGRRLNTDIPHCRIRKNAEAARRWFLFAHARLRPDFFPEATARKKGKVVTGRAGNRDSFRTIKNLISSERCIRRTSFFQLPGNSLIHRDQHSRIR